MLAQDFAAGRYIHFVPGLAIRNGEVPDVMRGEETQIIGAGSRDEGERLYVLPGSHSKWALVRTDRIVWFATFMTGEVFAALRGHTILGRTMEGEAVDGDAFARGVAAGRDEDAVNGGLLRRLFGARTLALFDELAIADGPSYLSGLLIGAELREALAALPGDGGAPATLTIVGRSDLAGLYRSALTRAGLVPALAPDDAAATGLWRIARAAGLIGEG
jgi:2-dehydro-3-deoxygalactonokinase